MTHNFVHSFLSDMNYVDGNFIVNDLDQIAKKSPEVVHSITWIPMDELEFKNYTERVKKSIGFYADSLPSHLKSHKIEVQHISKFSINFFMQKNGEVAFIAEIEDDRGKLYQSDVRPETLR